MEWTETVPPSPDASPAPLSPEAAQPSLDTRSLAYSVFGEKLRSYRWTHLLLVACVLVSLFSWVSGFLIFSLPALILAASLKSAARYHRISSGYLWVTAISFGLQVGFIVFGFFALTVWMLAVPFMVA